VAFPPSPGQRAAGVTPPDKPGSSVSVSEALGVLESHASEADNPNKVQAAIKTLRSEFDTAGPDAQDRQQMTQSPGRRAAALAGGNPASRFGK
jgi:hypothetical protein